MFELFAAIFIAAGGGVTNDVAPTPQEIMRDTRLGDRALGNPDAKVVVIEYYSSTCTHCAQFHLNQWPEFKEKYVKTNKIKFVMRPFFLNSIDAAAMVVTHCVDEKHYYPMIDELLSTQSEWARSALPRDAIEKIAGKYELDAEGFKACLTNNDWVEHISDVKVTAIEFGVSGTPSFFVNGVRYNGNNTAEALGASVEAAMAN